MNFLFFFNSILIGLGLAMDAFSVSLANGLHEPKMKATKHTLAAAVFGIFQGAMPLIGWVCVHTIVEQFAVFEKIVPYIALVLLLYIGGKMIYDGVKGCDECGCQTLTIKALIVQGIATSIDALSVGFTIAKYIFWHALVCVCIIAVVTFICCLIGIEIGKRVGDKLSNKATIFGGAILIIIGIEIFITGIL